MYLFDRRKAMVSIRLPESIENRLDLLSEKTGRPKAYYIRAAVLEHLEELEDIYLSLNRLEKRKKRWPLKDLENGLDLDS
jgi:RHH-type rel operon transcriptional repressor/antitoxin RelB